MSIWTKKIFAKCFQNIVESMPLRIKAVVKAMSCPKLLLGRCTYKVANASYKQGGKIYLKGDGEGTKVGEKRIKQKQFQHGSLQLPHWIF